MKSPGFILGVIVLAAVLLIGVGVLTWVRRWRQATICPSREEQLKRFRELFLEGELSEEEFGIICRMYGEDAGLSADDKNGSR